MTGTYFNLENPALDVEDSDLIKRLKQNLSEIRSDPDGTKRYMSEERIVEAYLAEFKIYLQKNKERLSEEDIYKMYESTMVDNQQAFKILIDAKINVNVRHNNSTPLLRAIELNKMKVIDATGWVERVDQDVIGHLLRAGADIEARDKDGCTALLAAVKHGSGYASEILDKGANVKAIDNEGNTVLHYTNYNVDYLIAAGADIEAINNNKEQTKVKRFGRMQFEKVKTLTETINNWMPVNTVLAATTALASDNLQNITRAISNSVTVTPSFVLNVTKKAILTSLPFMIAHAAIAATVEFVSGIRNGKSALAAVTSSSYEAVSVIGQTGSAAFGGTLGAVAASAIALGAVGSVALPIAAGFAGAIAANKAATALKPIVGEYTNKVVNAAKEQLGYSSARVV